MLPDATPATHDAATPVRYDYLDALRGWAFLGVLSVHAVAHTGRAFPGANVAFAGKYGVQLFFMVSAFTIFLTLDRARWNGWRTCSEFFIRRFFRILPMFWVGLALYAFLPGRAEEYARFRFTPLDYALTALLQHGWRPALINSLVPGGWSIAVEGAFYLVAPFCFRVVRSWQAAGWLLLGSLAATEAVNRGLIALYFGGHLFAEILPRWSGNTSIAGFPCSGPSSPAASWLFISCEPWNGIRGAARPVPCCWRCPRCGSSRRSASTNTAGSRNTFSSRWASCHSSWG